MVGQILLPKVCLNRSNWLCVCACVHLQENVINTSCGHGVQNLSPPQAAPLVWTVGCVQALASLLEANVVPVSCAVSGIAVLQASHSLFAFPWRWPPLKIKMFKFCRLILLACLMGTVVELVMRLALNITLSQSPYLIMTQKEVGWVFLTGLFLGTRW